MPCDEDFEKWDTPCSQATSCASGITPGSKWVRTVSLEACMEDKDSKIHSLPAPGGRRCGTGGGERLLQLVSRPLCLERDRTILELRGGIWLSGDSGCLGYKTHSAVIKRMEAIKKNGSFDTKTREGQ